MPSNDLVILDFDGVMTHLKLDSESVRSEAKRLYGDEGFTQRFSPLLQQLEAADLFVKKRDTDKAARLKREFWTFVDQKEIECAKRALPRFGIEHFFDKYTGTLAVYSNNNKNTIMTFLNRFDFDVDRITHFETRDGSESIKPSGDRLVSIVLACEAAKQSTFNRVFFLGDHLYDIQSCHQARQLNIKPQLYSIGLLGGVASQQQLDEEEPDFIATDLKEALMFIQTQKQNISLSVVLLAYNEEKTILRAIKDVRTFCREYVDDYEIIVVDDGSHDNTAAIADKEGEDVVVVRHLHNLGMGAAMRTGYHAARKDYAVHLAADRQCRAYSMIHLIGDVNPKQVALSLYSEAHSGFLRKCLSWIFRKLLWLLGGMSIDFAGTYIFPKAVFEKTTLHQTGSNTFVYSFQLLEAFRRVGLTFKYAKVTPFRRSHGKSRVVSLTRIWRIYREIWRQRGVRLVDEK